MTAVLLRPGDPVQWGTMPGWGIVADLTPPELIDLRKVVRLRKWLLAGLIAVLLLCGAGYALAVVGHNRAADDANAAADRTTALQAQLSSYSGITRIETLTQGNNSQIGQLLTDDVDVPSLARNISRALPTSMQIQSLSITIQAGSTAGTTTSATSLDASGRTEIGTVSISGTAKNLVDLPTFVDQLSAVPGVVAVLPQSDQAGAAKHSVVSWSLTAEITDQLLSHRFTNGPTGGR